MTVTPLRRAVRVLVGAAAIGLLVGAQPAGADSVPAPAGPAPTQLVSAAPATDTITWAVDPATAEGPDGRAWAELDLDPGEVVTDHLAVRNLGKREATFALKAADGYFTDKGRFSMLTSAQESTAAGTWIEVQDSVTVEPGGTAVVPFTVSVPENATPGDHAAGIAASVTMIDGSGGAMDVESRIGFRVMTRVSGEIAPGLVVDQLTTSYDLSWNPVAPGQIGATVLLTNTGNVALTVDGTAAAGGSTSALGFTDGAPAVELLPGDSRLVSATITDVWPMGPVGTEITAVARIQGTDTAVPAVTAAATTWAVPWSQLLVLAGVALLILAWRSGRRGSARRRQELLDRAREEGRSQAARELQPATGPDRR